MTLSDGVSAVTGNFTANVTGNTLNLSGQLTGQRIAITDGISAVTGNFSGDLTGTTQTLTGQLTGQRISLSNGMSAVTGNFSGTITANAAVITNGSLIANLDAGNVATGRLAPARGGTGLGVPAAGQLLIGTGSNSYNLATMNGTASQITVTSVSGSITLSLPQDITPTASVIFGGVSVNGAIKGSTVQGNCSALTNLNASNLASGTISYGVS